MYWIVLGGGVRCSLRFPQIEHKPAEEATSHNKQQQDANPRPDAVGRISKRLEQRLALDDALLGQVADHARTIPPGRAMVVPMGKLVDRHAARNVGLVVDVIERVPPKRVHPLHRDDKPARAHPNGVDERDEGQRDEKVGNQGAHQHSEPPLSEETENIQQTLNNLGNAHCAMSNVSPRDVHQDILLRFLGRSHL